MFHPNASPDYHHRGPRFHRLMSELQDHFRSHFHVPDDFYLIFMGGSGALALEACVYSMREGFAVEYVGDKFADQLCSYRNLHWRGTPKHRAFVHYETSTSTLNSTPDKADKLLLVDCVSSFPYYPIPPEADIWVTVSGKQLGAPPGVAIIGIRERVFREGVISLNDDRHTYLNLSRHLRYGRENETPNTPPISILQDLYWLDRDWASIAKIIDNRWKILCAEFGTPPGQSPPVYTFPGLIPKADDWGLYGQDRTQLFLYNNLYTEEFDHLMDYLKGIRDESSCASIRWA